MIKSFFNSKFKICSLVKQDGFTLVEMLIAVGLFSVIASISIGALLIIFDANRRSESSKTVVDNLNLSLENMVRTVRFGNSYHCGESGTLSNPADCSDGGETFAVQFDTDNDGDLETVVYKKCGSSIKRSENGVFNCNDTTNMKNITSGDTVIERLKFYVLGSDTTDFKQPYVVAHISGYVGTSPTEQSKFSIQTLMSQRIIDL